MLKFYKAEVVVFRPYEGMGTLYEGLFSTPALAEVAVAASQQEIAPEEAWVSHGDGSSSYKDDEALYEASVTAVRVFETLDEEQEYRKNQAQQAQNLLLKSRTA